MAIAVKNKRLRQADALREKYWGGDYFMCGTLFSPPRLKGLFRLVSEEFRLHTTAQASRFDGSVADCLRGSPAQPKQPVGQARLLEFPFCA
jgi:hypothetical protein